MVELETWLGSIKHFDIFIFKLEIWNALKIMIVCDWQLVTNSITKIITILSRTWKTTNYDLKICRTKVQSVKILQMFWQPFRFFDLTKFSKQFLFQNKPNNDKLFVFSWVKIVIPNQYWHIFFQFQIILQYLKKYVGFNWLYNYLSCLNI